MLSVTWFVQDDHEHLADALEDLGAVATRLDNRFFLAWYHCALGYSALHRGQLDTARSELEASLDDCRSAGEPVTDSIANAYLAELELLTGEYDAARERLEALLAHASAAGGAIGVPIGARPAREPHAGMRRCGRGARSCRSAGGRRHAPKGASRSSSASALSVQGAALLATGDTAAARAALEESFELGSGTENPWLMARAEHQLAALARRAGEAGDAEDLEHAALARCHSAGLLPQVVISLEALAAIALDHESAAEADAPVRRGGGPAIEHRHGALADRTACVRRRARSRPGQSRCPTPSAPHGTKASALSVDDAVAYASRARGERKRPSSGWASLTPTEERVVALAAEGLTNAQIAERMFVAPGTVKVHLGHIFTKLGVATRAELAGLPPDARSSGHAELTSGHVFRRPATMLTVAPMITAPNTNDSSAWRSTVCRSSRFVMSVSETWYVMPTVNAVYAKSR